MASESLVAGRYQKDNRVFRVVLTSVCFMNAPFKNPNREPQIVETERMVLRPFQPSDVGPFQAIYGDSKTMRHMLYGVKSRDETIASIDRKICHWEEFGYGLWCIVRKDDGAIIGQCGLAWMSEINDVQVAYLITRQCWGKGFATEAVQVALDYGFNTLEVDRISAICNPENIVSRKLMKKFGLSLVGELMLSDVVFLHHSLEKRNFLGNRDFCSRQPRAQESENS